MTPYYTDDWLTVWQGDCREVMAQMPAGSVHTVVTSPPYWGLRDYGIGEQGLGLEPTPEEYVANMVAVFHEVRRVLRADGTCWVNLGDSYAGSLKKPPDGYDVADVYSLRDMGGRGRDSSKGTHWANPAVPGLKPKDLVGIPWRVAFALQADGWYLRSDIIWSKPNPMPESVTDRPTKAHEYLFLLSKSPRYYYDADAVRESKSGNTHSRGTKWLQGNMEKVAEPGEGIKNNRSFQAAMADQFDVSDRNLRSVWSIATQPYPGAHFATFPERLVEPCVKAGTSERGVCPECGAPWRRVVETTRRYVLSEGGAGEDHKVRFVDELDEAPSIGLERMEQAREGGANRYEKRWYNFPETTGWERTCAHDAVPVPATVLDPFAGSGTTGRVAQRLGRRAVLIDLSAEYLMQAMERNQDIPLGLEAV